eukprot:6183569-Prymnesium_polylepis.1
MPPMPTRLVAKPRVSGGVLLSISKERITQRPGAGPRALRPASIEACPRPVDDAEESCHSMRSAQGSAMQHLVPARERGRTA